jgi:hypothetical protein
MAHFVFLSVIKKIISLYLSIHVDLHFYIHVYSFYRPNSITPKHLYMCAVVAISGKVGESAASRRRRRQGQSGPEGEGEPPATEAALSGTYFMY